jgi:hypothetical protein
MGIAECGLRKERKGRKTEIRSQGVNPMRGRGGVGLGGGFRISQFAMSKRHACLNSSQIAMSLQPAP